MIKHNSLVFIQLRQTRGSEAKVGSKDPAPKLQGARNWYS
jgi:hypothetical protein